MASGWPSLSQHYCLLYCTPPVILSQGKYAWTRPVTATNPKTGLLFWHSLQAVHLLIPSIIPCPRIATKLTGVCYSTVKSPEGGLEFQSRAVVTVPPQPAGVLPNLSHYVLNQYTHQARSWPYHYYCHIVTIRIGFRGKCQNDHLPPRLVQNYSKQ